MGMKLRFAPALLVGIALIIAFAIGAWTAAQRGWGSPLVEVSVENTGESPVKLITLSYTSCGATNVLTAQNISSGKGHTFNFLVCGEGGYTLEATLNDGRVLSSGAYVESGYATREQIEPTRIRTSYRTY